MSIDYVTGDDHVVTITINRPEARNSLDMEHFFHLRLAWERFGEDDNAYVAVITGVGQDFCVGADLKTYIPQITALQRKMKAGEVAEVDGYRLDDGIKAVLRDTKLYKPIIAAVNGNCVAGGMEMLGGCDLRVASDIARFARPLGAHVNLIPLNPTPGYAVRGSTARRVRGFRDQLDSLGVNTTVRMTRGAEIDAACGQLAASITQGRLATS